MTDKKEDGSEILGGFNSLLGGLGDLVKKLGDLAEKGESLKRSGTLQDKDIRGAYGYSVHVGAGGVKARVEPVGKAKQPAEAGESADEDVREPVVDLAEEDGCLIIEAEMPGVRADDVVLDIQETRLVITAERGERRYRKVLDLEKTYAHDDLVVSCNSGVLRIKCLATS